MPTTYASIPGYPHYRVGSDGSLWSKRVHGSKYGSLSDEWTERAGQRTKAGYVRDALTNKGGSKRLYRHQIVLMAFKGPCPKGMEACHENDVKHDNRLENLSWGTRSKNCKDAFKNGGRGGEKNSLSKLSWAKAKEIRCLFPKGWSLGQLATKFNVSVSTVRQVVLCKTWRDGSEPIRHRNTRSGSDHAQAKLTWEKVREIRSRYAAGGVTQLTLAKKFDVGESSVKRIIDRKTWKE